MGSRRWSGWKINWFDLRIDFFCYCDQRYLSVHNVDISIVWWMHTHYYSFVSCANLTRIQLMIHNEFSSSYNSRTLPNAEGHSYTFFLLQSLAETWKKTLLWYSMSSWRCQLRGRVCTLYCQCLRDRFVCLRLVVVRLVFCIGILISFNDIWFIESTESSILTFRARLRIATFARCRLSLSYIFALQSLKMRMIIECFRRWIQSRLPSLDARLFLLSLLGPHEFNGRANVAAVWVHI